MQDGELFPASAVAALSEGVCAVGVFVELQGGTRGRIVRSAPAGRSDERWWLVRVDSRPIRTLLVAESKLAVRS